MPILVGLVGAVIAWYFFFYRARNAVDIATDIAEMANDVRLAARRFGFTRQANVHPVESIEDRKLATAAIVIAFMELDDLPTAELRAKLGAALRSSFVLTSQEADEMQILGQWLVNQCGSASAAVSRIGRKLGRMSGQDAFLPLMSILTEVFVDGSTSALSRRQQDALDDLRKIFRIRE